MKAAMIIPLFGLVLLPLSALLVGVRAVWVRSLMGRREFAFPRALKFQFVGVLLCAPVLIFLNYVRDFDLIAKIAITGTGVLGFHIALADIVNGHLGGIYENGIVWNGSAVFFRDLDGYVLPDAVSVLLQTRNRERRIIVPESPSVLGRLVAKLETVSAPLP